MLEKQKILRCLGPCYPGSDPLAEKEDEMEIGYKSTVYNHNIFFFII